MDENTPVNPEPQGESSQPPEVENEPVMESVTAEIVATDQAPAAESGIQPVESAEGTIVEALPESPVSEILHVDSSMALSVSAQNDAKVRDSMVFTAVSGKDMEIEDSMDVVAVVGGNLSVEEGAVGVAVVGGNAQVEKSYVGLLVAQSSVTLNDSQVLMTTQQALVLGAAFGAVYALLRWLFGRKK